MWRSKDKSAFDNASLTVSVSLQVSCRFPNLIIHAAYFRRVVKTENYDLYLRFKTRFPKEHPKNTQMIPMVKT